MCVEITRPDELPAEGKAIVLCVCDWNWFGMFLKPLFESFTKAFTKLEARTVVITSEEAKEFREMYPLHTTDPYVLFFHNRLCYAERRDVDCMTLKEYIIDFVKEAENHRLKDNSFIQIQW
jgi:hypothetical protein